jgi:hypothetical protein
MDDNIYYLLHDSFLLGLFFYPEDGGDMFLWNVSWLSMDYIPLYPRIQNSSKHNSPPWWGEKLKEGPPFENWWSMQWS